MRNALTSEEHMSDPRWRDQRPIRPYGGEPGARPRGRGPVTPAGGPGTAGPGGAGQQALGGAGQRGPGGGKPVLPAGRGDAGAGPPTRRMPAQPGAIQNGRAGRAGSREARTHRSPRRPRGRSQARRWGWLPGSVGVCIIIASAAAGALVTMATRNAPGALLGLLVVAGTAAAALAVRPGAGRLILPVPALSYLAAAVASGIFYKQSSGASSLTGLAISAAQWIADGFFAMAFATALAVAVTVVRWYLRRRRRGTRTARDPGWPDPPGTARPGTARRPRPGRVTPADTGYSAGLASQRGRRDGGPTGGRGDAAPRGPAPRPPRPGPGPYNFSSGA